MIRPPTDTISGQIGIVIIPDSAGIEAAYAVAREVVSADAEYRLAPGSIPHCTLYHGRMKDLPLAAAGAALRESRALLSESSLVLGPIAGFGGNFIFWEIDSTHGCTAPIFEAHRVALNLSLFLDRSGPAKSIADEKLSLRPAELENLRKYGHPLAGDLFSPHITVGFHPGAAARVPAGMRREARLAVGRIELVRIGHPGRIEEVLSVDRSG